MTEPIGTHENYHRRSVPHRSSDQFFGWVMAVALSLAGVLPLRAGHPVRWWALAVSAVFAVVAILIPDALRPLNLLWTQLGLLMNRLVQPVVMAVVFFLVFTPCGFVLRLFRALSFVRSYDGAAATYWTTRLPAGPERQSMSKQF